MYIYKKKQARRAYISRASQNQNKIGGNLDKINEKASLQ